MSDRSRVVVKICGLSTAETIAAAVEAGADMVGFVFFEPSPRNVALQTARELGFGVPAGIRKVALLVDANDALINAVIRALAPDILQLHGRETPHRVAQIRASSRLPVMKAVGIATAADVAALAQWAGAADHLLVDAKPPPAAAMPGGHGKVFDWGLLEGRRPGSGRALADLDHMLSGGLDPGNVAEAIRRTKPWGVDVSSGVEIAPGMKDTAKIRAFVQAARGSGRAR